jgi:hypothetical protein
MPRKPSAHAELDGLRQDVATARLQTRNVDAELESAKQRLEDISDDLGEAYVEDDAKAIQQRRQELQAAEAEVKDLAHQSKAAGLRVERAQQQLDSFLRDNAKALLEERLPAAREVALHLTRAGHELVRAHQAYVAMRMEVEGLVAGVPDAVPRLDGVAASYVWERELKDLARAVRENPEAEVPTPRWAAVEQRQLQDNANRFERLRRKRKPTDEEHAINQEVA